MCVLVNQRVAGGTDALHDQGHDKQGNIVYNRSSERFGCCGHQGSVLIQLLLIVM